MPHASSLISCSSLEWNTWEPDYRQLMHMSLQIRPVKNTTWEWAIFEETPIGYVTTLCQNFKIQSPNQYG